jgi:Ca2+-binding EF-hand superfamily protein
MKFISASVLAMFLAAPVMADDVANLEQNSEQLQLLVKGDANKDGTLSTTEFTAVRTTQFKTIDTDASGYVNWTEFKAAKEAKVTERQKAMFALLDTDSSGTISQTELTAKLPSQAVAQVGTVFKILDIDGDGGLNLAELGSLQPVGGAAMSYVWQFAALDTDSDQKISLAEFTVLPKGFVKTLLPTTRLTKPSLAVMPTHTPKH